jgi:hypothetical protein
VTQQYPDYTDKCLHIQCAWWVVLALSFTNKFSPVSDELKLQGVDLIVDTNATNPPKGSVFVEERLLF